MVKISNPELAKIAIQIKADTNPSVGFDYLLREKYPELTEKQRGRLYGQMLDSGLVKQEFGQFRNWSTEYVYRFVLVDGITEEML